MFLLMYNKHTIYKELMKIDNHYIDASVAIAINTDDVEPDFFDRIKINNWDDHNKYLFIFNEISKNTVANFIKGVKLGVWKGIIFDFPEPQKEPYVLSILKTCEDEGLAVYWSKREVDLQIC